MSRKLYFTGRNYIIFAIGLGVLTLGFYLMSVGPYDSFWSLTLSPLLVLFSLAVVFPYGIMKNFKNEASKSTEKRLDNKNF
ncbi:MAG: hypothetical protein PHF33_00930 [Candidatus Delongbacteria bacterium]|jgi:hypothetical protein|nr:hypothetical protein [Candidatus Delongbacteria bacterium]MDD4204471.1 hypothetical protein [Candidatus Delongbacteria bacterium]MDY0016479.1 hypothetical protein [Candidatus Delongbacteria bacterium]